MRLTLYLVHMHVYYGTAMRYLYVGGYIWYDASQQT